MHKKRDQQAASLKLAANNSKLDPDLSRLSLGTAATSESPASNTPKEAPTKVPEDSAITERPARADLVSSDLWRKTHRLWLRQLDIDRVRHATQRAGHEHQDDIEWA